MVLNSRFTVKPFVVTEENAADGYKTIELSFDGSEDAIDAWFDNDNEKPSELTHDGLSDITGPLVDFFSEEHDLDVDDSDIADYLDEICESLDVRKVS